MRTYHFCSILLLLAGVLLANPIDITPIIKFSELWFNDVDEWTLELLVPFGEMEDNQPDSIYFFVDNDSARLTAVLPDTGWPYDPVMLITANSLSTPLTINPLGDSLKLYTYSNTYAEQVRVDELIFGNVPGATVGAPKVNGSIMRYTWQDGYYNYQTVDFMPEIPSPGVANDTTGCCATLTGVLYDSLHNPVTAYQNYPASPSYLALHTPIGLRADSTYSTRIFHRFDIETVDSLDVYLEGFVGWRKHTPVQSFSLEDIQPGCTIFMDIYLQSNEYVVTGINKGTSLPNAQPELFNYPNPFNNSTRFYFSAHNLARYQHAGIHIYNATGQRVKSIPLRQGQQPVWNGTSQNGQLLPTGVYYYQLELNGVVSKTGAMLLLK